MGCRAGCDCAVVSARTAVPRSSMATSAYPRCAASRLARVVLPENGGPPMTMTSDAAIVAPPTGGSSVLKPSAIGLVARHAVDRALERTGSLSDRGEAQRHQ